MERWYRADFDVVGIDDMHDDYFDADSDEQAIEIAKEMASWGLELVQVVLVDETTECYNEIKTIYW